MNNDITLRDYLAAHAPAEPQAWFEPVVSPPPEQPKNAYWCEPCKGDYDYGVCTGGEHCVEMRLWLQDYNKWHDDKRKARLVQWPYAWADAMIEEREKARGA